MDPTELVEQRAVFVRRFVDAARMGVDRADDREIGGERMELEDRVTLAADGPRDQDEFRDCAFLGPQDCAQLAGIHVAGRLQDHPQSDQFLLLNVAETVEVSDPALCGIQFMYYRW